MTVQRLEWAQYRFNPDGENDKRCDSLMKGRIAYRGFSGLSPAIKLS